MLHNTEIQLHRTVPEKQLFERSSTPMAAHTAKIAHVLRILSWICLSLFVWMNDTIKPITTYSY